MAAIEECGFEAAMLGGDADDASKITFQVKVLCIIHARVGLQKLCRSSLRSIGFTGFHSQLN